MAYKLLLLYEISGRVSGRSCAHRTDVVGTFWDRLCSHSYQQSPGLSKGIGHIRRTTLDAHCNPNRRISGLGNPRHSDVFHIALVGLQRGLDKRPFSPIHIPDIASVLRYQPPSAHQLRNGGCYHRAILMASQLQCAHLHDAESGYR